MTKKERNTIYKIMLDELFDNISPYYYGSYFGNGLCSLLYWKFGEKYKIYDLPELWRHKPKKLKRAYWWGVNPEGTDKRICVLLEAIMETL